VHLNVGGRRFTTLLSTLRAHPDSRLAKMFSGDVPAHRDSNGVYCIDRDGRLFHYILNYLRDGMPPLGLWNSPERLELLREAAFYGLSELHSMLGGEQNPKNFGHPHSQRLSPAPWSSPRRKSPQIGVNVEADSPGAGLPTQILEHEAAIPPLHLAGGSFHLWSREKRYRMYVRLRNGHEYPGEWVVTSPRGVPGVQYELHDACVARTAISALNKMSEAGFVVCEVPQIPPVRDLHSDNWDIRMYKDVAESEVRLFSSNKDAKVIVAI